MPAYAGIRRPTRLRVGLRRSTWTALEDAGDQATRRPGDQATRRPGSITSSISIMSLNRRERETTARELDNNLALTGLTRAQVRERTGLPPERFQAALEVNAVMDPADVWLVRDTIEDAVREEGKTPLPYSKLTDSMRRAAAAWFGYRQGDGPRL